MDYSASQGGVMDTWRPDDWKNPYPITDNAWLKIIGWGDVGAVYEAGANAMLSALRERARLLVDGSEWVNIPSKENCTR